MPRLTRKQKQEHTRHCLMEAAVRVFGRRGLGGASIDEVAADAGFTKGAFYANFKSKEELFLAMLDERFAEKTRQTEEAFAGDEHPPTQARASAAEFARTMSSDPEGTRLFMEFAAHALRNEPFRDELLRRFATLRRRLEEVFGRRAEEYGLQPTVPIDRVVRMVIAMADGWALWRLLEPGEVDEQLLEDMTEILTTGFGVMSRTLGVPAEG